MDGMRSVPPATMRSPDEPASAECTGGASEPTCFARYPIASSTVRGRSSLNCGRLNRHLQLGRRLRGAMDRVDDALVLCRDTKAIHHVLGIVPAIRDRRLQSN